MMDPNIPPVPQLKIRYTLPEDHKFLKKWLQESSINDAFSFSFDEKEVEHAVMHWICFHKQNASLTAIMNGVPCGMATLFLNHFEQLSHHSECGIIIAASHRNRGIGKDLMNELMKLAKEKFHLKILSIQVSENNPAMRLYKSLHFAPFGFQKKWIKKDSKTYIGRYFMERNL